MSRIGNAPITLPEKVEIKIDDQNVLTIKGPKGEVVEQVDRDLELKVEDGVLTVSRPTNQKRHKALHGLTRALINNMVVGVSEGYKLVLELVGVGFRANSQGQVLELSVGYSHPVVVLLPKEITLSTEMKKGQNPMVTLESTDKQLIGQVAATIRKIRKPEPYKGKGIRFQGEQIRRKAGKSAAK